VVVEVVVVMPAYNEGAGIAEFLEEVCAAFADVDYEILVQDDGSTDDTAARVVELSRSGLPIRLLESARNRGHGPSTLAVLREGVATGARQVVAVDSDGQFLGVDLARLARVGAEHDYDVVEGVRSGRKEPVYRAIVSAGTRLLVWARCRRLPRDANTPLRVYRAATLSWLLGQVPESSPTPNLHICAVTRSSGLRYAEVPVEWLVRPGGHTGSSGFGARLLPSGRFVVFVARALRQWARTATSASRANPPDEAAAGAVGVSRTG
jgi:hypothetical protein